MFTSDGERPTAAELVDEDCDEAPPCGGYCPPEGCWSDRCRVGQPSEEE